MPTPADDEATIFNIARQIGTPEGRQQYLQQACEGDAALRSRIEALLRAHDEHFSFFQSPATVSNATAAALEGPGAQVGGYKLLEKIGEGGFGVVYSAEQKEPVRRFVAVKILKPGMDTRQVVARFEAERQALALMDHPNIAKVLDAGVTSSGRPYFVMELVKGIPITRYCDEQRLTPRERLSLFFEVCSAVQHSHQKGVIHRDIKPTNVLVAAYDGRPVPRLIDFGVAKALGQQLTERTLFTGFGGIVGTLEYMSPEQAEFNALDVDTRTDIYSLGVLLYELLTGTTPLTHQRLQDAAMFEVLRLIREEEPPKPSARLSDSKQTLASISAQRKLEPAQLERQVRGDLDWIVMKAIAKDRNRRYRNAGELADEVARYLRGDAVLACPPSIGYRLRKLVRKHRTVVAAGTLTALALIAGTAISVWQAVVATSAHSQAVAAAALEKQASQRAQAKEAETRSVLAFVQNHVFALARPEGKNGGLGHDVTLRRALQAAKAAVSASFKDQPLVEARIRQTLGDTFFLLGDANDAAEQFSLAWTIHREQLGPENPDTLTTANKLALAYDAQGRYPEARDLFEQTLAVRTAQFGPEHVDTVQSMDHLATVYSRLGRYPEALQLRKKVAAIRRDKLGPTDPATLGALRNLANSYSEAGLPEDALRLDQETLTLYEAKFGVDHPDTLACRNNLALDYADAQRYDEALKFQKETLKLCQTKFGIDHPSTLVVKHNVAKAHADLHQYEEAITVLNETLALQRIKPGPDHPDTIQTIYSLANNYGSLKRYADALRFHQEALALRKLKLGPSHRHTLYSMWGVAANLIKLDRYDEAIPVIDECLSRAAGPSAEASFSDLADKRLRYFEQKGDANGCRATAELWEKLPCTDSGSYYNAARFRAVAAALYQSASKAEFVPLADDQAERAMAWLKKVVAAGYKDAKALKTEKDFNSLRSREDFQKLLSDLERKSP